LRAGNVDFPHHLANNLMMLIFGIRKFYMEIYYKGAKELRFCLLFEDMNELFSKFYLSFQDSDGLVFG